MSAPRVTIGIPCYNQAEFLGECLEGVLASTCSDWEAIVVDDASTDVGAGAVVRSLRDPRIRVIRHETNRGLGAARNTAFAAAAADLLLPLDADDSVMPEFLARTVDALDGSPATECVFTDFLLFGSESGVLRFGMRRMADLSLTQWIPGPGTLMRRPVWERVGGYCEDRVLHGNEDWDFWLAAAELGVVVSHVPEPLYRYRKSTGSLSIVMRDYDIESRELIHRRHRRFFDTHGASRAFLAEGCLRTALSAAGKRRWRRALRMGARAARLSPRPAATLGTLLRAFALAPVRRVLSAARGRARVLYHAVRRLGYGATYRFPWGREAYWEQRAPDIHEKWGTDTVDCDVLRAVLARVRPRKVLDVGCGSGRLFPLYLECGVPAVVGQDVSETALRLARSTWPDPRIELVHRPLLATELPPGSCDLCVSSRVLQHVPDREIDATVARLCGWSRWVYICELAADDPMAKQPSFYIVGRDYVELFRRHGFEVADRDGTGALPWILFGRRELVAPRAVHE